ncbi:FAD:protein FMN transferase [Flavobacterium sp. ACAM 123]|jgi:thiamine biosynthesis lipoprotein|uniref:FAD:protein FMN transferase n=1 Tax=Flavobacterium sp. ACAM 123 TaxID=1189620 RepID=UPI0002F91013|nr:FAD:protein FMN transferase [Flavobacterium sp. ACAM 123]
MDPQNTTIFFKNGGMKLGLGGIGQGLTADKIKALLISKSVIAGILILSGNNNTWANNLTERNGKSQLKTHPKRIKFLPLFHWKIVLE